MAGGPHKLQPSSSSTWVSLKLHPLPMTDCILVSINKMYAHRKIKRIESDFAVGHHRRPDRPVLNVDSCFVEWFGAGSIARYVMHCQRGVLYLPQKPYLTQGTLREQASAVLFIHQSTFQHYIIITIQLSSTLSSRLWTFAPFGETLQDLTSSVSSRLVTINQAVDCPWKIGYQSEILVTRCLSWHQSAPD